MSAIRDLPVNHMIDRQSTNVRFPAIPDFLKTKRGMIMSYIYQADLWCNDCGESICAKLDAAGNTEDRSDESSYDSDDYPKGPFSDNDEADSPCHCASGDACPNALTLDDGSLVGPIVSGLTPDGADYVRESADSPCSRLWRAHYGIGQFAAIFPFAILAKILFANS